VLNGDCVEWLETVYYAQFDATFLEDGKPSRSIGGVGLLVYTCVDFSLDNLTHLFINARRYGHIAKYPRFVFDDGVLVASSFTILG